MVKLDRQEILRTRHQPVHDFTQAGMEHLLKICQIRRLVREARTVVVLTDCKRRRTVKYYQTYHETLRAVGVQGKPVRLGPCPTKLLSFDSWQTRILPTVRVATICDNELWFEIRNLWLVQSASPTITSLGLPCTIKSQANWPMRHKSSLDLTSSLEIYTNALLGHSKTN